MSFYSPIPLQYSIYYTVVSIMLVPLHAPTGELVPTGDVSHLYDTDDPSAKPPPQQRQPPLPTKGIYSIVHLNL